MQESDQQTITQPKQKSYLNASFLLILCLLFMVTFVGGYLFGGTRTSVNRQDPVPAAPSPATEMAPSFEFKNNIDPSFLLLTSPSFAKEIKGKSFQSLSCLSTPLKGLAESDEKLTIDEIKAGVDDGVLVSGLNRIQNNEYDFLARSYKGDDKTIDREKMIKVKAEIDLFSVCEGQDSFYVLFNANVPWSSIQKKLFSLVPPVYAAGGPQFAPVSYLAKISKSGDVRFINLGGELPENKFFVPISTDILKKYGYTDERKTEMLFPEQILGKVDNSVLISFETRCYECRDNPKERSLYVVSLDSLTAKELAFCRDYESAEQQCYDQQGMFASIK